VAVSPSSPVLPQVRSPLADCLVALAGTPDDSSWIDAQLTGIAHLAADLIPEVRSASVTAAYGDVGAVLASSTDVADDGSPSLSVPMFAGRGTVIALLNLYGGDPRGMAVLARAVRSAYEPGPLTAVPDDALLDSGASALVTGLVEAFAVRATIQQAIGILILDARRTADIAYLLLRMRAAATGIALPDTAAAVIAEKQW
jgi:hypothetical protein